MEDDYHLWHIKYKEFYVSFQNWNNDFFDFVFSELNIIKGFKCFLIVAQNSLTIMDVMLFARPHTSLHICNEFPLPNIVKTIVIQLLNGSFISCFFFWVQDLHLEP